VEVVTRDGFLERRSMIYTEYFVRGSEPTALCPLHEPLSLLDRLAGVFGKDNHAPPVPADEVGPTAPAASKPGPQPTPPAATRAPAPAAPPTTSEPASEEPKKKRGFWSRVFGLGKDKEKKQEAPKKPGGQSPR
jgi:hypothetical protein